MVYFLIQNLYQSCNKCFKKPSSLGHFELSYIEHMSHINYIKALKNVWTFKVKMYEFMLNIDQGIILDKTSCFEADLL